MKLYLSSYFLGDHPEKLADLVGSNKKTAVIQNAVDYSPDLERRKARLERNCEQLVALGLEPEELDLRNYFGKPAELEEKIKTYGLLWVTGGNCFVLRRAMQESGLDEILIKHKGKDNFAYGGYSAGVCVLTPTLKGIDLADDPEIIPEGYKEQTIWDGLGLLNYSFAPHYRSNHYESEMIERCVEYFIENKMLFKALHDGEVLIEEV